MKILHTEASCGWGGQEIRILTEARGLIGRGHRVELVCPAEAQIFAAAPDYGVPVHALPIGRKNLRGLFALHGYLRQRRFDVVNTHSSTDSWLAALACRTFADAPPVVRTRHLSTPVNQGRATRWLYEHGCAHVVVTGEALKQQLVAAHLAQLSRHCDGRDVTEPLRTVMAGGEHHAVVECTLGAEKEAGALRVAAFLTTYYGNGQECDPRDPMNTVTLEGTPYVITDIGLRMLTPRELFRAQGFPESYQIERGGDGRVLTKTAQVRMCGNSVCPPMAKAYVAANYSEAARERMVA